jgi:hypothetical protein
MDAERLDSQRVKTSTTIGWRNYRKPGYGWQRISNLILPDRTITKQNFNVQLPESSQGWLDILFDSQFSQIRYNIDHRRENREPSFELSICAETQHNVTGHIDPNNPEVMVYANAWDGVDLLYHSLSGTRPSFRKIFHIKEMPAGDGEYVEYSFLLRSNQAKTFVDGERPWDGNPGENFTLSGKEAFIAKGDSQVRGCFIGSPKCWWDSIDEEGEPTTITKDIEVNCSILSDRETVRVTKRIPRSYIQQALSSGSTLSTDTEFHADTQGANRHFWVARRQSQSNQNQLSYEDMMDWNHDHYRYESTSTGRRIHDFPASETSSSTPPKAPRFHKFSGYKNWESVIVMMFFFDTFDDGLAGLAGEPDPGAENSFTFHLYGKDGASASEPYLNIYKSDDDIFGAPPFSVHAAGNKNPNGNPIGSWHGDRRYLYRSIGTGNTSGSNAASHNAYTAQNGAPLCDSPVLVNSASYTTNKDHISSNATTLNLNSAGRDAINKNDITKIMMTFSDWDSRVGGSDPAGGTSEIDGYVRLWHPYYGGSNYDGAELVTTFKQVSNPGGFWFMG